jgi:hypothetical protein
MHTLDVGQKKLQNSCFLEWSDIYSGFLTR